MSKLNDVVKNNDVRTTVYDKLAAKVNNIEINDFFLNTKYQSEKAVLEKKIPDISNLIQKTT